MNKPSAPARFRLDAASMRDGSLSKVLCTEFLGRLHHDTSLNMSLEWQALSSTDLHTSLSLTSAKPHRLLYETYLHGQRKITLTFFYCFI